MRIVRRGSGPVVTWRRAQMVPLSAQGMDPRATAKVAHAPASRPRLRASYIRTAGVRHLLAAYELGEDKLFGHIKPRKTRSRFLEFCRNLRSLYPPDVRIAIVCDNYIPHLTTART